jgi:hypothetical protein
MNFSAKAGNGFRYKIKDEQVPVETSFQEVRGKVPPSFPCREGLARPLAGRRFSAKEYAKHILLEIVVLFHAETLFRAVGDPPGGGI